MKKPILLVMAAGMGSRYGGAKQIDPVGPNREIIMDYSLFDARKAGFERIVFVIKRDMREAFDEVIGKRIADKFEVQYAYQDMNDLPTGFDLPDGRVKPWGTGHAILAARRLLDAPFAAINADDYYGKTPFATIYPELCQMSASKEDVKRYVLLGYDVANTLSEYGAVTRGVCETNAQGLLTQIVERMKIMRQDDKIVFEDERGRLVPLLANAPVSMNFWGFPPTFVTHLAQLFETFLRESVPQNPLKAEFLLPTAIDQLMTDGLIEVAVLPCKEQWFGVTYQEDKPAVVKALADKATTGQYPAPLWG